MSIALYRPISAILGDLALRGQVVLSTKFAPAHRYSNFGNRVPPWRFGIGGKDLFSLMPRSITSTDAF